MIPFTHLVNKIDQVDSDIKNIYLGVEVDKYLWLLGWCDDPIPNIGLVSISTSTVTWQAHSGGDSWSDGSSRRCHHRGWQHWRHWWQWPGPGQCTGTCHEVPSPGLSTRPAQELILPTHYNKFKNEKTFNFTTIILRDVSNFSYGWSDSWQPESETQRLDNLTGDAAIGEIQHEVRRGASINHLIKIFTNCIEKFLNIRKSKKIIHFSVARNGFL